MIVKTYVATIIQLMFWSGFHLAQWLSGKDHVVSRILIFAAFFYLAFIITKKIVESNRRTFIVTLLSIFAYGLINLTLQLIFVG
ncbi:hypothetical protein [Bacillus niameyensis]|uniref:hypothetical protein n=1 Tax=Bacillus niameyensis TaxID=1522308 RepID=UPI0007836EDC|nr:hypothetical protein [Bacillus niameyensis]